MTRSDRDKTGKFVKGKPGGPGRPRGPDFRAIIERKKGIRQIEADAVRVYDGLVGRAAKGDATAAKVWTDRMCGPVTTKVEHSGKIEGGPEVPTGPPVPPIGDVETAIAKLAELSAELKKQREGAPEG